MYKAEVRRKNSLIYVTDSYHTIHGAESAAKQWILHNIYSVEEKKVFSIKIVKVPKSNPPAKGKWMKVKAVKFNKDGSVSLMK